MKVIAMNVGALGTNCYIAYCEETKEAAVIDPGGDADKIMRAVKQEGVTVKYIINTHGHIDHIQANLEIKEKTSAPLLIHKDDADMLVSSQRNLSAFIGGSAQCGPADRILREGDTIELGRIKMEVLHTPGHTLGGICLKAGDILFSGDTLFAQSIGRTDFPGGSYSQLLQSVREKLLVLPDEVKVYPGHGPETTIGFERRMNPFIQ